MRLRRARTSFVEKIYAHAVSHREKEGDEALTKAQLKALRVKHEAISMICEVFAILDGPRKGRSDKIEFVLKAHNSYIDELLSDAAKRGTKSQDFPRERLKKAKFSERQIRHAQRLAIGKRTEIDQSALGSLLAPFMSFETCRKLIGLLEQAGLLTRFDVGHMLVGSPGHLEKYYRQYLRDAKPEIELSKKAAA